MYKQATKLQLRFETSRGELSIEQMWSLSRTALATIVRNLKKKLKQDSDNELAFLDDTVTQVDEVNQLKFDIVKDIYLTKKAEIETEQNEAENKLHNQKILEIIKRKQDGKLEEMSVEDLEKLIK